MGESYILIPVVVALCALMFFVGWYLQAKTSSAKLEKAGATADKIVKDAENKASSLVTDAEKRAKSFMDDAEKAAQNLKKEKLLEVKDEFYRRKQKFDEEVQEREKEVVVEEKRLKKEREELDELIAPERLQAEKPPKGSSTGRQAIRQRLGQCFQRQLANRWLLSRSIEQSVGFHAGIAG